MNDRPMDDNSSGPARPRGSFATLMVGCALLFTSSIATGLHYRLVSLVAGSLALIVAAAAFVRRRRWDRRGR
jgi:hypothetical protein